MRTKNQRKGILAEVSFERRLVELGYGPICSPARVDGRIFLEPANFTGEKGELTMQNHPGLAENGNESIDTITGTTTITSILLTAAEALEGGPVPEGKAKISPENAEKSLKGPEIGPFQKPIELVPKPVPGEIDLPPDAVAPSIEAAIGITKEGLVIKFSAHTNILTFNRNNAIAFAKGMLRAAKRTP